MKTYCKNIDITDKNFIKTSVYHCLDGKWHKDKTLRFLANYDETLTKRDLNNILLIYEDKTKLDFIIDRIVDDIQEHIINKNIEVPPIKYKEKYDCNSGKTREIGVEHMLQQCYEYVAVDACMIMFQRKIGKYQCASIPKRGQNYGKNAIYRWVKYDEKGTKYFVKLDVQKCYPSINQSLMKKFLHRDIKNYDLLYLLDTMIETFTKGGLSIGSHLSQWLCNYFLSYAYHYLDQEMFTTSKNGKRRRLISHQLFYMDDIILFSSNKKHLKMAVDKLIKYFEDVLGLTIKKKWSIHKVQYTDKNGKIHGTYVDMMGFQIYRDKVTIRKSIFLKIKRQLNKMRKKIRNHQNISLDEAYRMCSYNGWIKNTNSLKFSRENEAELCMQISKEIISRCSKNRHYIDFDNKYRLINTEGERYDRILQSYGTN